MFIGFTPSEMRQSCGRGCVGDKVGQLRRSLTAQRSALNVNIQL